jgi:FMN phosphatase YigB (HAD superfamily)/DNA-binding XRE family transcriptional regulator
MDEVGLGRRLQVARQAAGLTQQDLCQQAHIAYSTLAKIERGAIKSPSIFTIIQIAEALHVSLDELIGHTVTMAPIADEAPPVPTGRSKTGITFVYFDINGCLVRFFHRAFTKLAQDTGASADLIETTFWHYNDAACRGELSHDDFNRIMAERLGIDNFNWQDYYMQAVDPVREMDELLQWATTHYRVGLLSNIMPGFVEDLLGRNLIPNVRYAAIVDSSKIGAIKPEAKIYETAQELAGVPAEEILFVDDSRTNLMAAEHLGWHVMWFDDFNPDESIARIRNALELEAPSSQPPVEPPALPAPDLSQSPSPTPDLAPHYTPAPQAATYAQPAAPAPDPRTTGGSTYVTPPTDRYSAQSAPAPSPQPAPESSYTHTPSYL